MTLKAHWLAAQLAFNTTDFKPMAISGLRHHALQLILAQ
jgi:hypothetical protein